MADAVVVVAAVAAVVAVVPCCGPLAVGEILDWLAGSGWGLKENS